MIHQNSCVVEQDVFLDQKLGISLIIRVGGFFYQIKYVLKKEMLPMEKNVRPLKILIKY